MSSHQTVWSWLFAAALPLSLVVLAAPAVSQSPACAEVSFMTYNVRAPGWNQNRRMQVVGAINQEAPDVLGLHEARPATSGAELLVDLQADYEPHHANTNDPIYLKRSRSFTVLAEGTLPLPACSGTFATAVLTWVKVETPEPARFFFYNVHLCVSQTPGGQGDPLGNQAQAIAVSQFMDSNAEAGTAQLLAGDLNASQTSLTIAYLIEQQALTINSTVFVNPIELDDTWSLAPGQAGLPRPGTTAGGGPTALDWILSNPGVEVLEAEVIQFVIPPGQAGNFSDHLPVTAVLRLPNVCAYGCGTNSPNSLSVLSGAPAVATTLTFGVDNPLATQNAGSQSLVVVAFAPDPNFPCGTAIPGWGMAGSGADGELLVDLLSPHFVVTGATWTGAGSPAPVDLPIPPNPDLAGLGVYVQGMLFDASPTASVVLGLGGAVRVVVRL